MDTRFQEIVGALGAYFDGFHEGDIDTLKSIFHPNCHLYSAGAGSLADDDMEAVYARVRGRQAPAAGAQTRQDRILSIDLASPEAALAKVQLAIGDRLFTDYLSLLKLDGSWRIISKTYSWVIIAVETEAAAAE